MLWAQRIQNHYEKIWQVTAEVCEIPSGRNREIPDHFFVLRFPPHGDREMWTYATCGMSIETDGFGVELHIFSPVDAFEIVELLTAAAHYHRTAARLNQGHTINIGRPWLPGSQCQHALLSLPYIDGPDLQILEFDVHRIDCLWLVPITLEELEFKKLHGVDALEDRFDAVQLKYLAVDRSSVV